MKMNTPKLKIFSLAAVALLAVWACSGEDRSNEQPRVPVVSTAGATVAGDSCRMMGTVGESHNSSLRECGFVYWVEGGNSVKLVADTAYAFSAVADSLEAGNYSYAAYARNGMGTTYGDTLTFSIQTSTSGE